MSWGVMFGFLCACVITYVALHNRMHYLGREVLLSISMYFVAINIVRVLANQGVVRFDQLVMLNGLITAVLLALLVQAVVLQHVYNRPINNNNRNSGNPL